MDEAQRTPDGVIDFYFDFSSPYSYMAAERIEALARAWQHQVAWKPILLGATFRTTGSNPLTQTHPWKASYSLEDFERSARLAGIAYRHPERFPQSSVQAARALLTIERDAPDQAVPFAQEVFRELFVRNGDIDAVTTLERIAASLGIDVDALREGMKDEGIRQHLRALTSEGDSRGVFGAPMFILGKERFWGFDRLAHLEAALRARTGGRSVQGMVDAAMARVHTLSVEEARALHGRDDVVFVDIRDVRELERDGLVPGALHAPRGMIEFWVDPGSPYHKAAFDPARQFVFYCAAGWRSALTTATVQDMGFLPRIAHIDGGFKAWKDAGGEVQRKKDSAS